MFDQGSERGSDSSESPTSSTFASNASSQPSQSSGQYVALNAQQPTPSSLTPLPYGNLNGQVYSQAPNQIAWPNRPPSSLWRTTAFLPNGPIFSVPSELWLQIIGNLDMPGLERLFSALYFIFRPLGIFPPANSHPLPRTLPQITSWLGNGGTLYDVMTRYPYEIVDDIFQQLTPQEKVNVVLALHNCDQG